MLRQHVRPIQIQTARHSEGIPENIVSKMYLPYDFASRSDITSCIKADKPLDKPHIFVILCIDLFDLILYVPSTIFQLNRDGSSWVEPVLS